MRNVILLLGPGESSFDETEAILAEKALKAQGPEDMLIIGDGKSDITSEDRSRLNSYIASSKNDITLVILVHGKNYKEYGKRIDPSLGTHHLCFQEKELTPTVDFYKEIAQHLNGRKIDIFLTSCQGGGVHELALKVLPKGSTHVALARSHEIVKVHELNILWSNLASGELTGCLSAESLLLTYLSYFRRTMKPYGSSRPIFFRGEISSTALISAPTTHHALNDVLVDRLGRAFTEEEMARILKSLSPHFGRDELVDVMEKISTFNLPLSHDLRATCKSYFEDYGAALAVAHAAERNWDMDTCRPALTRPDTCPIFSYTYAGIDTMQCPIIPAEAKKIMSSDDGLTPFAANMALAAVVAKLIKDGVNYLIGK
jgi:hypothetical protein